MRMQRNEWERVSNPQQADVLHLNAFTKIYPANMWHKLHKIAIVVRVQRRQPRFQCTLTQLGARLP